MPGSFPHCAQACLSRIASEGGVHRWVLQTVLRCFSAETLDLLYSAPHHVDDGKGTFTQLSASRVLVEWSIAEPPRALPKWLSEAATQCRRDRKKNKEARELTYFRNV